MVLCPLLLFSVCPRHRMKRMLIVHTCIRWSWDRTPWLLEFSNIFSFLGVLSTLMLILWFFHPVVLFVHFCFSLSAHVITWWEYWLSTPLLWDHLIVHLDCWSIKTFSHFWGFSPLWFWAFCSFVLWCFCPFLLFSVCPHHRMKRMLIVHTCIRWSCNRTPWLLEFSNIFSFLDVLSTLMLILWFFHPVVLFVHFCFSLSAHVITWWEYWLSTPVSCDHGFTHLDFWSIKIFFHFWGFCPLSCLSFGAFVLWCFCPFLLFFVHPRHRMTRMLVVHTCIRWSWDRTPWLLEY